MQHNTYYVTRFLYYLILLTLAIFFFILLLCFAEGLRILESDFDVKISKLRMEMWKIESWAPNLGYKKIREPV